MDVERVLDSLLVALAVKGLRDHSEVQLVALGDDRALLDPAPQAASPQRSLRHRCELEAHGSSLEVTPDGSLRTAQQLGHLGAVVDDPVVAHRIFRSTVLQGWQS